MPKPPRPKLWSASYINVCIANFLMACSFNLLMPTIPLYITEQLGVAQSDTGIVLASYTLALLVVRPFSGYLVDLYARKKVLLISFIIFVLVFFGYFWATTVAVLVLVRVLHGAAWGVTSVATNTLAIDLVPSERRAEGISLAGTFMNLAMAIGPVIAIHVYHTQGFHTLIFCAIGMGVLGITAVAFIKSPPRQPVIRRRLSLDRFFLFSAWPVFLNQLFPCFAWGSVMAYVAQYGKTMGIFNVGIFFLFFAVGIMASRAFAGRLVDRGYVHAVNIVAMLIVAVFLFAFAFMQDIYTFCSAGLCIGLGFGSMLPAMQILYINMADSTQRGTASATYLLGFDVGVSIGMFTGGYISALASFEALYIIDALLCLVGVVVYQLVSRPWFERKKLR
ncbi:MFS transporter [Betaproteobacteria bacterium]|nr:MFS transporter [Betaproteobacteria bacterium]GHT98464.1 MFS transporter [Betaproteobacteria bacterium]